MDVWKEQEIIDEHQREEAAAEAGAMRLAEAIEDRLEELMLSPSDLVRDTGLSWGALAPMRKGEQREYTRRVKGSRHAIPWLDTRLD